MKENDIRISVFIARRYNKDINWKTGHKQGFCPWDERGKEQVLICYHLICTFWKSIIISQQVQLPVHSKSNLVFDLVATRICSDSAFVMVSFKFRRTSMITLQTTSSWIQPEINQPTTMEGRAVDVIHLMIWSKGT